MNFEKKHAMSSSHARRVQLTGTQLKQKFISDYTQDEFITPKLNLPIEISKTKISFTLKAGLNWQFRLGRIEELDEIGYSIINDGKKVLYHNKDRLSELFYDGTMFRKYAFPASVFICRNDLNWVIFSSEQIIDYITSNIQVRLLDSGRIKVDLMDITSGKYKAIFTLEYRAENHKKCFVFGAHGGNAGNRLREILQENCKYHLLDVFKKPDK